MKKLLSFLLLLIYFNVSSAQQKNDRESYLHPDKPERYYLQESRRQKLGAYILLASGLAAGVIGGIDYATAGLGPVTTGPYWLAGSGVALIGSTFLFVKAAKNKKRAQTLSLHLQRQELLAFSKEGLRRHWSPTATIKFSF